jgi:hypothetical protein
MDPNSVKTFIEALGVILTPSAEKKRDAAKIRQDLEVLRLFLVNGFKIDALKYENGRVTFNATTPDITNMFQVDTSFQLEQQFPENSLEPLLSFLDDTPQLAEKVKL